MPGDGEDSSAEPRDAAAEGRATSALVPAAARIAARASVFTKERKEGSETSGAATPSRSSRRRAPEASAPIRAGSPGASPVPSSTGVHSETIPLATDSVHNPALPEASPAAPRRTRLRPAASARYVPADTSSRSERGTASAPPLASGRPPREASGDSPRDFAARSSDGSVSRDPSAISSAIEARALRIREGSPERTACARSPAPGSEANPGGSAIAVVEARFCASGRASQSPSDTFCRNTLSPTTRHPVPWASSVSPVARRITTVPRRSSTDSMLPSGLSGEADGRAVRRAESGSMRFRSYHCAEPRRFRPGRSAARPRS